METCALYQEQCDPLFGAEYTLNLDLAVVCIVLGLVLILTAPNSPEVRQRYDDTIDKTTSAPYSISFSLSDTLTQPSYLYYGLQYYYQNHRRYLKFFSPDQMDGTEVDEATVNMIINIG